MIHRTCIFAVLSVNGRPPRLDPLALLAFVLLYWLLKQIGPVRAGLIIPFTTVVAMLLGVIILGEAFTWRTGVGGALVLGGLTLATRKGDAQQNPSSTE